MDLSDVCRSLTTIRFHDCSSTLCLVASYRSRIDEKRGHMGYELWRRVRFALL